MNRLPSGTSLHIALAAPGWSTLIYFATVFVISWGGAFLILGPRGLPMNPAEFENLGAALYARI